MALIQWNETFSVHVAEIDLQHQHLIQMTNDLYDAMLAGNWKGALRKIINDLIEYTQVHFATEEKYFAQFQYPHADAHKRQHAAFIAKVAEFRAGFEKGLVGLSIPVMQFLSDWLRQHIQGSDQAYASFFHKKGLK